MPITIIKNPSNVTATIAGTVAVTQSGAWSVGRTWTLSNATDSVTSFQGGTWTVAATQSGAWTVTALQGTSPWVISGTVAATQSGVWSVGRTWTLSSGTDSVTVAGTVSATQGTSPWVVSGTVAISGTVAVTQSTSPWVVSGTVTANQGGAPWSNNISQWGGTSTTLGQKVMASSVPVTLASDQSALVVTTIPGNPSLATYAASANFTAAALLATDVFTITGSGTKTIQVRKIHISGTNSGNTNARFVIVKRSTANSGGTSTTLTNVPLDSTDAAATATVRSYTVNPTLGTTVGNIDDLYTFLPTLASTNFSHVKIIDFGYLRDKAVYVRGTSEVLSVNLAGVTLGSVTQLSIKIEWTEE